jgi:hypothetical protein
MRKMSIVTLSLICLIAPLAVGQQSSCEDYDVDYDYGLWSPTGTAEHYTQYHQGLGYLYGECGYTSLGERYCSTTSFTTTDESYSSIDLGSVEYGSIGYYHQTSANGFDGEAASNGGTATSGGILAATATSCLLSCSLSISFSVSSNGLGGTVNFPATNLNWTPSLTTSTNCQPKLDPQYVPPPPPTCCTGGALCTGRDLCVSNGDGEGYCVCETASPIVIDTAGKGFQFTSAEDGVLFDITGNGHPIQMAWIASGSGNAFLALDRNGNGMIDSGKELFGNFTAQPQSDHRNGYAALAEFDKPENGGNGDGIIDKKDAVFSKLLLWIDENHDGISQMNELHKLPELGVYSISLHYSEAEERQDAFGNLLHYRAALNPDTADGKSKDGRWTYDVFFMPAPGSKAAICTGKNGLQPGKIIAAVDQRLN